MVLELFESRGIHVGDNLVVDAGVKKDAGHLVISHAHSDHVNLASAGTTYLSKETLALVQSRYGDVKHPLPLGYGKHVQADGLSLSLHNAGHILGSAQVLLEGDGTLALTSDFKLEDSLVSKAAEPLDSEVLVIESTFGTPAHRFPPREEVYQECASWVKKQVNANTLVLLAGYALGKSQELVALCNEFLDIEPYVHSAVFENCKHYQQAGVKLGGFHLLKENAKEAQVLVVPPHLVSPALLEGLHVSAGRRVVSAMATGWANRNGFSKLFALSDHADFDGLMEYVEQSAPRMVYTTHGFDTSLATFIRRRLGVPAQPLKQGKRTQRVLEEF